MAPDIDQAARRLRVSPPRYQLLEAGEQWPWWEEYDRIAKTFGWPQTFR